LRAIEGALPSVLGTWTRSARHASHNNLQIFILFILKILFILSILFASR